MIFTPLQQTIIGTNLILLGGVLVMLFADWLGTSQNCGNRKSNGSKNK